MPLAMPAPDVWTLLAEWAEQTPGANAFLHGERTISFAELHEQSLRAAQGLADLGVGPGAEPTWVDGRGAPPLAILCGAAAACARAHPLRHHDAGGLLPRVRRR